MKKLLSELGSKPILFIILIIITFTAISWGVTCGIIYLITLCFELNFSLKVATGIWLVLGLLSGIFSKGSSK